MALKIGKPETDKTMAALRSITGRQWPFIVAKSLTNLAQLGQKDVQVKTREQFNLHSEFVPKGVGIIPAKKADAKIGQADAFVITKERISTFMPVHETGGTRRAHPGGSPRDRGKYLAIPQHGLKTKKYRTNTGKVRKTWKPGKLLEGFTGNTSVPRPGRGQKRKAFITTSRRSGNKIIVRRTSRKKYPLEVLYVFKSQARMEAEWGFEPAVVKAVSRHYINVFNRNTRGALIGF